MGKSIAQGLPIVRRARIVAGVECSTAYSKKGESMKTEIELLAFYRYGLRNGGAYKFAPVSEWILQRIPAHLRAHAVAELRDANDRRLMGDALHALARNGL